MTSVSKATSVSFALQSTFFATMKNKLAIAENRVRECETNNVQVRKLPKENEFLRLKQTRMLNLAKQMCAEYEADFEPATCNKNPADESSEVANTVDTLVDTIAMTHADVAVEQPDESAHYNVWRERINVVNEQIRTVLQKIIINGMKKMRILIRFIKKVVQIRRRRIHQEQVLFRFVKKVVQYRRQRITQYERKRQSAFILLAGFVRDAEKHAQKCAQEAQDAVDARKEIIRKEQELALSLALDNAIEIPHSAQLHAHKFAQQAEDAVNAMLENIGEEQMNEELDNVASESDVDESVESVGEIQ
jgi:hypothetical protein